MTDTSSPTSLIEPWSSEQKAAHRDGIVTFRHGLADTGLFTDESLARMIDSHPRAMLDVLTMHRNPPPNERWIAGDPGELTGTELVEAVRRGSLWLSLRQGMNVHAQPTLDRAMGEFAGQSGAEVKSAKASILISGPDMGIFFHVDTAETMLWHVRGHKTMLVYPPTEAFCPESALEAILHKETLSDAPWRPEMEAHVRRVPLGPGEAAHWELNAPHRVLNGPDLNVSVSIEYATPRSRVVNGTYWFNGWLRRRLGVNLSSRRTPEALRPLWWAAAKAAQRLAPPPAANVERAHERQFDVDLSRPDAIRWRPGHAPLAERLAA